MPTATLHDGSAIEVTVTGTGPAVLLPVNPHPVEGPQADAMRQWGADPSLGHALVEGLRTDFTAIAFDYEAHVLATPKPATLAPGNIAADFLAIADTAGADRFAYYGYSWLALSGMQLAVRTDRLWALAMGGFPPIDGPYAPMLTVTTATHDMALNPPAPDPKADNISGDEFDWSTVEVSMSPAQTQQFVTLYKALRDFDDRAAQAAIDCPRLCFAGSADDIEYGPKWGDVTVKMAGAIKAGHAELTSLGWRAELLDGLDHTKAMQADAVLPLLRPWLKSVA